MPHLRDVLREARENAGVSHAAIAVQINRVENVVRRFEKGASAPAFAEIDGFVEAYGYVTGVDPLFLWGEALRRRMEESRVSPERAEAAADAGSQTDGDEFVEGLIAETAADDQASGEAQGGRQ